MNVRAGKHGRKGANGHPKLPAGTIHHGKKKILKKATKEIRAGVII